MHEIVQCLVPSVKIEAEKLKKASERKNMSEAIQYKEILLFALPDMLLYLILN